MDKGSLKWVGWPPDRRRGCPNEGGRVFTMLLIQIGCRIRVFVPHRVFTMLLIQIGCRISVCVPRSCFYNVVDPNWLPHSMVRFVLVPSRKTIILDGTLSV